MFNMKKRTKKNMAYVGTGMALGSSMGVGGVVLGAMGGNELFKMNNPEYKKPKHRKLKY